MRVFIDAMMRLAGLIERIDVNDDQRKIIEAVKQLMAYLARDRVSLGDRHLRVHRDVDFGVQAVAQPAGTHLGDLARILAPYSPGALNFAVVVILPL